MHTTWQYWSIFPGLLPLKVSWRVTNKKMIQCFLISLLFIQIILKGCSRSTGLNNFIPFTGTWKWGNTLNPRKDVCNCCRIRIIKLFINLLKARVVTKPSSWDVAFIPYIDLAPRPNLHSFHIHNCSQFSICRALSNPLDTFAKILCFLPKLASQCQPMES
jgi:hypothetical protein